MIIRPYVIRIFNLFNSPSQTAPGLWVSAPDPGSHSLCSFGRDIKKMIDSPGETASRPGVSVTLTHLAGMSIIYFFLQTKHACPIKPLIFDQLTIAS
jgi:hypothetical protein